jgi:hypothetical protein
VLIEGSDWTRNAPRKLPKGEATFWSVIHYAVVPQSKRGTYGYAAGGKSLAAIGAVAVVIPQPVEALAKVPVKYVFTWEYDQNGSFLQEWWQPDVATALQQYPGLDWKQP